MSGSEKRRKRRAPELLDQLPDIVLELATDGRILFANRVVEKRFGISPDRLLGHDFSEFLDSTDRDRTRDVFRKVVATGSEATVRCKATHEDRGSVEFEVLVAPTRGAGDAPTVCAVCREVTAESVAAEGDRLRRAQTQALFESGLEATAIATASGQIRAANRRFRELFAGAEDFESLAACFPEPHSQTIARALHASTGETSPPTSELDLPLQVESLSNRWITLGWSRFQSESGERLFAIQARDVTRRKLALQSAMRAPTPSLNRNLLERLIAQVPELIFFCDLELRLLFANASALRHLRLKGSEGLRGRSLFEVISPPDRERMRRDVLPRLTPSFPWSGELSIEDGPGEEPIPMAAQILLFRDDVGLPEFAAEQTYLSITLRDLRPQRQVEEALRQSELRLAQAHKLETVGRLAGGIAHDFNNLLTAIIGYSDLVLSGLDAEHGARADLEEILRAAERAGGLTRQLLAFSRRQALVEPAQVDLNAVVADIDRMLRRLIGEDIELVTRLAGGLDPIVADPGRIEQVIVNLVVNARDAMLRGGRLEIETSNREVAEERRVESGVLEPGRYAALRVADTGIGMSPAIRAQIFEPFFTTKGGSGGTGLGLASVHGIVSQCGGQIEVESEPDQGSAFTVYLPIATEASAPTPKAPRMPTAGGRETVLLVEDSGPVRRLVERTLQREGYTVLAAESATAALRHCSRHEGPIDLILTDVVLPRMAGPELAAQARLLRPETRVLYMSGFTDETLAQHGLESASGDLLEKPFSSATLLDRIRRHLDGPRESA